MLKYLRGHWLSLLYRCHYHDRLAAREVRRWLAQKSRSE